MCSRISHRLLGPLAVLVLVACQPPEAVPQPDSGSARRIVSLAPHITELVYSAGAGDQLVGTVEYSDYPADARAVTRIGDSFRVDYERLDVLDPDLVLAWQSGNPAEIVERLRALRYRVVELEPSSLDDIASQLRYIGELAGTVGAADKAAARFNKDLQRLRDKYRDVPIVTVFYQVAAQPYFTISERHVINEAIELCGGRNVFAQASGIAPSVTLEAIIAADPQVIIASVLPGEVEWQGQWQRWASMQAVQTGNLYGVDPDLISRSGPRIVQGVAQLCSALEKARSES